MDERGGGADHSGGSGEDGGVSLSLAETVLDQSAGAHSQSSSVGVLLLVESRSRQESRNLVDSALEVTIVSSLGVGSRVSRPLCLDEARFSDGLDQKVEILISCSNNSASLNMKLLIKQKVPKSWST